MAVAHAIDVANEASKVNKSAPELVSTSPRSSPRGAKVDVVTKENQELTPVSSINKGDDKEKEKSKHHRGHHSGNEHLHQVPKTQSAETSGGNSADAEKERERERLEEEWAEQLRAIRQKVDTILESTPVVTVMAILTVWALFSDDLRLAAAPPRDIAFTDHRYFFLSQQRSSKSFAITYVQSEEPSRRNSIQSVKGDWKLKFLFLA